MGLQYSKRWRTLCAICDYCAYKYNTVKLRKLDALKFRVCIEDEANVAARHAWMDIQIGRKMGKSPVITTGRIIVELFDDIMPRTVDQFIALLESESEPTYRGSQISKIFPGFYCVAGDRQSRLEGVTSHSREAAAALPPAGGPLR